VLIIMADQLGRSVGDMYKGAFLPGFMLTGLYALYVILLAIFKPQWCLHCPRGTYAARRQRQERPAIAAGADCHLHGGLHLVAKNMPACTHGGQAKRWTRSLRRNHRGVHVLRRGTGFRCRQLQQDHPPGPAVACGRTSDLRADPPLLLIFLVLGTIFLGMATPTEGGAMGALGAIVMAVIRGRLSMSCSSKPSTTTKLSCFVVFILMAPPSSA
jgi:TRAP-type mannitol/chloroaromatic compound transport system permease large subunit